MADANDTPPSKKCRRCEEPKLHSDFNSSARHADGLFPWCKPCRAEYAREWWRTHPEKHREYDAGSRAQWIQANPDRRKAIVLRQNTKKRGLMKADYLVHLLRKRGVGDPSGAIVDAFREILRVKRLVKKMEDGK